MLLRLIRQANFFVRPFQNAFFVQRSRSSSLSALRQYDNLSSGKTIHGYTVTKVSPVTELSLVAIHLSHDKTGAEHLHIARDDLNNVFGVALQTTPLEDTGVPHILEHTVLCGSENFPVRDPFFKMLDRSLATFMNAFTSADWTMYPFSSQNPRDFENLLSVYLDAVFFPRIREEDFKQEGWRLEHEDTNDPKSPIIIKGVVYNEMKGVFNNAQNLFTQKLLNVSMPSHTYGFCSGGDPLKIPLLTWEGLKKFHATHYHPSNSRFYTYGNFPLEKHLKFINDNALSKFYRIERQPQVPLEDRWATPKSFKMTCPPDPMAPDVKKQTTMAVSYLLKDVTDVDEAFILSVLCTLLVVGEKSPFYKSLIESKLGSDYAPELGYDGHSREARFTVGLQGLNEEDVPKVQEIINETFDQVIQNGFSEIQIEAVLHQTELAIRHQSEKFGLHLGMNVLGAWLHGADPANALQIDKQVENFNQKRAQNPKFLQDKVVEYFKNNSHHVYLVMTADENFNVIRIESEKKLIQAKLAGLMKNDLEGIYDQGLELQAKQSAKEDLSCLPSVGVSDIAQQSEQISRLDTTKDGVHIQQYMQPTNGVTYFRAVCSLTDMSEDLLPYVPLFCNVLTKMGAGPYDYSDLAINIELKTAGLQCRPMVYNHPSDPSLFEKSILFTAHCLDRNVADMFKLWEDIFLRLDWTNKERLHTLIVMSAAEIVNSVSDAGHRFAMIHAASSLSPAARLTEMFSGLGYVNFMRSLVEQKDLTHVVEHLQDIARHVLNKKDMRCALHCTEDRMQKSLGALEIFIQNLYNPDAEKIEKIGQNHFYIQDTAFQASSVQTQFELPYQVNFSSRAIRTVPYEEKDFANLRLLSRLMTTKFLHREIREKGGAYGGGAVGGQPGHFLMYSYRDPNVSRTLVAFDEAVEWAVDGKFTEKDLDEAKLGIFQEVDMPVAPGNKGLHSFIYGITDKAREEHRIQLLDANKLHLVTAAQKYLQKAHQFSSVTILGPENKILKESSEWKIKAAAV